MSSLFAASTLMLSSTTWRDTAALAREPAALATMVPVRTILGFPSPTLTSTSPTARSPTTTTPTMWVLYILFKHGAGHTPQLLRALQSVAVSLEVKKCVACHIVAKYYVETLFWLRGANLFLHLACPRHLKTLSHCRLSHPIKMAASPAL